MLFDDIVDRDRRLDLYVFGMRILRKQDLRVALNCLVGDKRNWKGHGVSILICIGRKHAVIGALLFLCLVRLLGKAGYVLGS